MSNSDRIRRIGGQLQRELATLIRDEVRDPRLGMVTVAEVRVSSDLSHAKVFVTVMGDEKACELSVEVLNRAAGFLRVQLGKVLRLRTVPQLHFVYDHSLLDGNRLSGLIDQAIADDQAKSHQDD